MINTNYYTDKTGLPIIPADELDILRQSHTDEEIQQAVTDHIIKYKPQFPLRKITLEMMCDSFKDLQSPDLVTRFLTNPDPSTVFDKFGDLKYPYSAYPLGVIGSGNAGNDSSNYFQQVNRYSCNGWSHKSPIHKWITGEGLYTVLGAIWRFERFAGKEGICPQSYRAAFRLASYVATQFKPHAATVLYDSTKSFRILDTSSGWGDRLAGFYASGATHYTGMDPNPDTFAAYLEQCLYYEQLLGCDNPTITRTDKWFTVEGKKHVKIYLSAAEDLTLEEYGTGHDLMFTSPPYFGTERYGEGRPGVENQSWQRYQDYTQWRDGFFFPMIDKSYQSLRPGGIMCLNIMDPKIGSRRYHVSDQLVDYSTQHLDDCVFRGVIGMRMKQRPRYIDDKANRDTFYTGTYIEPIWTFQKGTNSTFPSLYGIPNNLESFIRGVS